MKRVLTFLAIMLLPLSVMAMTPITDNDLSDVTGQAGVNINADLTMNVSIGTLAWGDATGVDVLHSDWTGAATPGYIGITDFNITDLKIHARTADNFNGYDPTQDLKPITIDVGSDAGLYDGRTFVRFGLGSLAITMETLEFDVRLGAVAADLETADHLGHVYVGPIGIYINPRSYVDIFSHGASGVSFFMDVEIDKLEINKISWGDTDGCETEDMWLGTGQAAGYVGVDRLELGVVQINGQVDIDVTTTSSGVYAAAHGGATTVVRIGIKNGFRFAIAGPIQGDVVLSSTADLTNPEVLGDFYISKLAVNFTADSWVDIWAH